MSDYRTFSSDLHEDEVLFAIKVGDVQELADRILGRQLDYMEMDSVQNGIEWGLDSWGDVVITSLKNLPSKNDIEDEQMD